MFGEHFQHFLSFGATDQQTVVALADSIDGLLIPGTIAAFQRKGTGGFVLALSASEFNLPYAIDPRFPLFQQRLITPKKAHESLAEILGSPELIHRDRTPIPSDFIPSLIETVGERWAEFNRSYSQSSNENFDKYARRLNEPPSVENVQSPAVILPPYLMSSSVNDEWWQISKSLFDATARSWGDTETCVRVTAGLTPEVVASNAREIEDSRVAIWVSGFDELNAQPDALISYIRAVSELNSSGKSVFALYGGFFAVLLRNFGLGGASHGIGYGEYRDWRELPQTGMPPARYYVPRLHRYLQPDEATQILISNPRLIECPCLECAGGPPNTLNYHALMRHSVRCRATEIESWSRLDIPQTVARLQDETSEWLETLNRTRLPPTIVATITSRASHLDRWIQALNNFA
jgi:hypothetical protein